MILLLGGTAETASIADALARGGRRVLVSTATEIAMDVGRHPGVSRRQGPLSESELAMLIRAANVEIVVDATHPYAARIREEARRTAAGCGIPYITYIRPGILEASDDIHFAATHEEAAVLAFGFGRPVLLTIGSRNLAPYARESRRTGTGLFARVLSHAESVDACRRQGIPEGAILQGRGPFDRETTLRQIREYAVGVMVTKDSGAAGGVVQKVEAARMAHCRIVAITRPCSPVADACGDIETLIRGVLRKIGRSAG